MYTPYYPEKFEGIADEQLVTMIHNGDEPARDFLIDKYKNLVKLKARAYFLMGSDKEDIVQEGMIGLFKAIRDYQIEKQSPFYTFAEMCITRQIITAIKTATRQKHIPLNSYVSLNKPIFEDESEPTYIDLVSGGKITNPEDIFIAQEQRAYIEANMSKILSKFECRVLILYLKGLSYFRIAELTERDEKSVDNAIQRIKRKIIKFLNEKNMET